MRYFSETVKKIIRNRVAQIFFLIHLVVLTYAISTRDSLVYPFHFETESILFKVLSIINLPGSIIAGIFGFPLAFIETEWSIILLKLLMFAFWQVQWALIGYFCWKIWNSTGKRTA